MTATVSAAIINWNSAKRLRSCVESLEACEEIERIIIVDNASTDDSLSFLSASSRVNLIRNTANLGFAAGINQAFRASDSPFMLVLNPDVEAETQSVAPLVEIFAKNARAGSAGGFVNERYLPKRFPTVGSLVLENLGLRSPTGKGPAPANTETVDQPAAAALLIRRAAFDAVGGFDEQFHPAWYEDVDFCLRLHRGGWLSYFVPAARFTHSGGYSAERMGLEKFLTAFYTNQRRFVRKHFGRAARRAVRVALVVGMLARMLLRPSQASTYWRVLTASTSSRSHRERVARSAG